MNVNRLSRRTMLTATAAVAACGGGASTLIDSGARQDSGSVDSGRSADGALNRDGGGDAHPDIAPLNALLAAEYAAVIAYDAGAEILMSPPAGDPLGSLAPGLLAVAGRFQAQHRDHAVELARAVGALGGTPIAESSVNFVPPAGFTPSVENVLKLAANAEKAAAIAYDSSVAVLAEPQNRFVASAIEGDETQHYVVLAALVRGLATPGESFAAPPVVPTSFVSSTTSGAGLDTIPNLEFTS